MTIIVQRSEVSSPAAPRPRMGADPFLRSDGAAGPAGANAPNHLYGGCSLQHFDPGTGAGDLAHTHEDAGGWLGYVGQFDQPNFYFQDGNVQVWEYNQYDDWQDYYGVDAVREFYHSGHGGMNADGVFFAPLGGSWGGQDWARSDQMNAGDEHLRYRDPAGGLGPAVQRAAVLLRRRQPGLVLVAVGGHGARRQPPQPHAALPAAQGRPGAARGRRRGRRRPARALRPGPGRRRRRGGAGAAARAQRPAWPAGGYDPTAATR